MDYKVSYRLQSLPTDKPLKLNTHHQNHCVVLRNPGSPAELCGGLISTAVEEPLWVSPWKHSSCVSSWFLTIIFCNRCVVSSMHLPSSKVQKPYLTTHPSVWTHSHDLESFFGKSKQFLRGKIVIHTLFLLDPDFLLLLSPAHFLCTTIDILHSWKSYKSI